ncbi:hypothetical protein ACL02U_00335 [Streptomyces sp. MS06]|uniref:hypothetical protein n=1 Tax=Streptomyces sp. MS06 TaxID=3385974 RepID=UPI0039A38124
MLMLSRLEEVLPALREYRSADVNPVDWDFIEREVGCRFPADFVEMSRAYPSFVLDDFLSVHVPEPGRERNFVAGVRQMLGTLRNLRDADMAHGYVPFPEPGGLVPWGDSCDGDDFYWRTVGDSPDDWTVLVAGRNDDWCEFRGTLTEYLAGLVSGTVPPDGLPPDFPGDAPTVSCDY